MGKEKRFKEEALLDPAKEIMCQVNHDAEQLINTIKSSVPYCRERISAREGIRNATLWVREALKLHFGDGEPIDKYRD